MRKIKLKQSISVVVSSALVLMPCAGMAADLRSRAGTIVVPTSKGTSMTTSANGTDVVNIATPDAGGGFI